MHLNHTIFHELFFDVSKPSLIYFDSQRFLSPSQEEDLVEGGGGGAQAIADMKETNRGYCELALSKKPKKTKSWIF
jgi:hypothetical protein